MTDPLKAPFPQFGGKSRAAHLIWPRLGDVVNYVEPFFGSGAVLLARPHAPKIETVNDLDCMIANFWRSIRYSPDAAAGWADWPVNETDHFARHKWLVAAKPWLRALLEADPEAHDPKIAGWWVNGASAWIGSGYCAERATPSRQVPFLGGGGLTYGQCVHALSTREPVTQLPSLAGSTNAAGSYANHGKGVHGAAVRSRILPMFQALSDRLRYTRVACGDFERVLSDSVTWRHGTTAILLDPEYPDGADVYAETSPEEGARHVFHRAAAWAVEHGADERLRICLCGYGGTFTPPEGWTTVEWKAAGGYGGQNASGENVNATRERLWFSPHCLVTDGRERDKKARKRDAVAAASGQASLSFAPKDEP